MRKRPTTGATVLLGLDNLPHSILFYRQELQWLGGMGIIVLAVAVDLVHCFDAHWVDAVNIPRFFSSTAGSNSFLLAPSPTKYLLLRVWPTCMTLHFSALNLDCQLEDHIYRVE